MIKVAQSRAELERIEKLADSIWREHYVPVIGLEQVEYMLQKFQSLAAMNDQIKNGYEYYSVFLKDVLSGYICFQKRREELFLSKIYILKTCRGKGMGKMAMDFIARQAKESGLKQISLTVNKNNINSINAYLKMGFINISPFVLDIGNGFIMDDYLMVKYIE